MNDLPHYGDLPMSEEQQQMQQAIQDAAYRLTQEEYEYRDRLIAGYRMRGYTHEQIAERLEKIKRTWDVNDQGKLIIRWSVED